MKIAGHVIDSINQASKSISKKRKNFPKSVREIILIKQAFRCKACKKGFPKLHFDHIDGDRSNNSFSNCQALCPNCHAKKIRTIRKK